MKLLNIARLNFFLLNVLFSRHIVCLYICGHLSISRNNSSKISPVKLKISMFYRIDKTFRHNIFLNICPRFFNTMFTFMYTFAYSSTWIWIRESWQAFQSQVSFTFSSVHIYYCIKSYTLCVTKICLLASVIHYCWKYLVKKRWIQCEGNRSRELSIESNMPPKK